MTNSKHAKRLTGVLLSSAALGVLTSVFVWKIDCVPLNPAVRAKITNTLELPGAAVGLLAFPEGIHTGHGSVGFAYVATGVNLALYSVLWLCVFQLFVKIKRSCWQERSKIRPLGQSESARPEDG